MNTPEQNMAETVTFSVRMPKASKERLEALAKSIGRSTNFVASEAIASYVDANAWQVDETRKAVEKADAGGPFVPHEEMTAWLESWGTDDELPSPPATLKR
jgi:predicted transcriptional regulator